MKRRQYLVVMGTVSALTGCTQFLGEDTSDVQDSDGDGVIDSEDYAPNDPDVQEKSDLDSGGSRGSGDSDDADQDASDDDPDTTEEADTDTEEPDPETTEPSNDETDFPSHIGTHTITAEDNFWSMELAIDQTFRLEYTARTLNGNDFDAFVFGPAEFEDYKTKIEGGFANPNAINHASTENIKHIGGTTTTLDAGIYHFVIDNTDIGDAGDWGKEATRRVHVELETGPA